MSGRQTGCLILLILATIRSVAAQDAAIRYGGLTLRSGQIIVADSYNAKSVLMTLSLRDFTTFTHSGVLAIENGRPVVYETYADTRFWHKGPPTDAMKGTAQRSTLAQYVEGFGHVEIYDPPERLDRRALVRFARESYRNGVPYDPYFSPGRRSYYCSELVAYALEAGGGSPSRTKGHGNESLARVRRWLGITADAFYSPDVLIENSNYRGAITRFGSRTTYRAYRAAKREIHRRFTEDQKLGNVFYLAGLRPKLREPIRAFIDRAIADFPRKDDSLSTAEIRSRVAGLAVEAFGALKSASPNTQAMPAHPDGSPTKERPAAIRYASGNRP